MLKTTFKLVPKSRTFRPTYTTISFIFVLSHNVIASITIIIIVKMIKGFSLLVFINIYKKANIPGIMISKAKILAISTDDLVSY